MTAVPPMFGLCRCSPRSPPTPAPCGAGTFTLYSPPQISTPGGLVAQAWLRTTAALLVLLFWSLVAASRSGWQSPSPPVSPVAELFINSLLGLAILSIAVNVALQWRGSRRSRAASVQDLGDLGEVLAVIGGFIALVAALLPWENTAATSLVCPCLSFFADLFGMYGVVGAVVWGAGLLWLVSFAIPARASIIWGLAWAGSALLLSLVALARIVDDAARFNIGGWRIVPDLGVYAALAGSSILLFGNSFLLLRARRKTMGGPALMQREEPPGTAPP